MASEHPEKEVVLAVLERLLSWPEMTRSPQLSSFLEFIVTRTLNGEASTIKAYTIAVDVFGRDSSFDPQSDPIVRVQARRLRALLEQYYKTEGAAEPLRISLPTGRYVPEFTPVLVDGVDDRVLDPTPPPAPAVPNWYKVAGLSALIVVLLGGVLSALVLQEVQTDTDLVTSAIPHAGGVPRIAITEFQDLTGGDQANVRVPGLAIELVTDLQQFEMLDVSYGNGVSLSEISQEGQVDFILTGIMRIQGDQAQYSAIITAPNSREVLWNKVVSVPLEQADDPDILDQVSLQFAYVLGSPRGPLHAETRSAILRGQAVAVPDLNICMMMFDVFTEFGEPTRAQGARQCLQALPRVERSRPIALAALGYLTAAMPLSADESGMNKIGRIREGRQMVDQAVLAAPTSAFAWQQKARLHERLNEDDQARLAFLSSLQLNPADGDALAEFARFLAFAGELRPAEPLSDAALKTPAAPAWYQAVPALVSLRDGYLREALTHAEVYARADREIGPVLAIIAAHDMDDTATVNRYLPQVLDGAGFRPYGILPRLRDRISDPALLNQMRDTLLAVGVPSEALTGPF